MNSFTVVIATFNAETTLLQAINSFVNQNYKNKQLIIIDGSSTDKTVQILKENEHHIDYWISEPDTGIYNAWNKALPHINGEWIYFLGADDYFTHSEVFAQFEATLAVVPEKILVAYGIVSYISVHSEYLYSHGLPWEQVGKKYRQLMTIPQQGVFHRKELFNKYGTFDESFRIAGDYELLLRYLKDHDAVFIPLEIAMMRQGGVSSDITNSLKIIWEVRRAQLKNGLLIPGVFWLMALSRVYIRLVLWKILGERQTRRLLDFGRALMGKPPHWTKNL